MKASVCFVRESFDLTEDNVICSLKAASSLIEKMNKGFVTFCKSSDFDENAAIELFKQDATLDAGVIMSCLYDQQMSQVSLITLDDESVVIKANTIMPVYKQTWMSIYSSNSEMLLTVNPIRTIFSEKCLVDYCSEILVKNTRTSLEYAESFVDIYNNLIFLDNSHHAIYTTFNSIRKIKGGYKDFIKGITDCLGYMNAYEIIPKDSQKNIDNLNAELYFPVTPEGAGKNERAIKALKRDFFINGVEYLSVNCEYHYKLERIDGARGNGTYYFNRIYFGFFNRIDPDNPKIAIAHIGEHL